MHFLNVAQTLAWIGSICLRHFSLQYHANLHCLHTSVHGLRQARHSGTLLAVFHASTNGEGSMKDGNAIFFLRLRILCIVSIE
jgi:hypothetical protein